MKDHIFVVLLQINGFGFFILMFMITQCTFFELLTLIGPANHDRKKFGLIVGVRDVVSFLITF